MLQIPGSNFTQAGSVLLCLSFATMDLSNLPPHLKLMILGHTDTKVQQEVMKVVAKGVPPVPLFSRLVPDSKVAQSDDFFSTEDLRLLEQRGFIVKDDFLSSENSLTSLPLEVDSMKTSGLLTSANMNTTKSTSWNDPNVRGDLHYWLKSEEIESLNLPSLSALLRAMDALREELNRRCAFDSSKIQVCALPSSLVAFAGILFDPFQIPLNTNGRLPRFAHYSLCRPKLPATRAMVLDMSDILILLRMAQIGDSLASST